MTAPLAPHETPGALERVLTRDVPGVGLIEFEHAPSGWLTQAGEVRLKDHHAYYLTPPAVDCLQCSGSGRVVGKRPTGKKCPDCDGAGWVGKRTRYPSVSTLLDSACPKPGLAFWSEARGIEGAVEAVQLGLIGPDDPISSGAAVGIVRKHRLGADRARDEAADRGVNVHACLETYMLTGEPPDPSEHPPEHGGYLRAMTRWLLETDIEPVAVEQLVAHPEDGYCGRLDLRGRIDGLLTGVDAKTQERAGIYSAAHVQINLYERAEVRCGGEPADRLLVVAFAADGEFREMPADHPPEFTDAALAWCRAIRPVDAMCEAQNRVEREARKVVA